MAQTISLSSLSKSAYINRISALPLTGSEHFDCISMVDSIRNARAYDSVYGIRKWKLWALRHKLCRRTWAKRVNHLLEMGLLHLTETGAYKLGPARAGMGEDRLLIKKVSEKAKANAELKEGSPSAVGAPRPSSEFEQQKKYDVTRHQTAGLAAPSVAQNKQVQAAQPPVMPPQETHANSGKIQNDNCVKSFNKLPRKHTHRVGLLPGTAGRSEAMINESKSSSAVGPFVSAGGVSQARDWGSWVDRFHPQARTPLMMRHNLILSLRELEATPEELAWAATRMNETVRHPVNYAIKLIREQRAGPQEKPPLPAFGNNGQHNGRRGTHSPQPLATRAQSPKVPDDDGGKPVPREVAKKRLAEIIASLSSSSSFEASEPSGSSPASDTHRHRRRRL